MSLETPDVEDKFVSPTASYDQGEVRYGNDPAETGASGTGEKTDRDSTKQTGGPDRRQIVPIPFLSVAADIVALIATNGRVLCGYEITEMADGAANIILRKSTDVFGNMISHIKLAAGATAFRWYDPDSIDVADGVFIDVVAGTVDIILYVSHE